MIEHAVGASASGLDQTCNALRAEPLFHLSLNSKELFHSNFLAWFIESYPSEAAAAFSEWVPRRDGVSQVVVRRERSHLDLAIELPGLAPFIVENKVFSPPDEDQLDSYAAGRLADLNEPELLLLSLSSPDWVDETYRSPSGHSWRYLSYVDLAEAFASTAEELGASSDANDQFAAALLVRYCGMARLLDRLVSETGAIKADDPIDLPLDLERLLRETRVHDAVVKLRARRAIRFAIARMGETAATLPIRWESGFTNGSPLNAAFLRLSNDDWLGWQYQQGQFRLAVITGDFIGKSPEVRARRHAYVAERYAAWFDFGPLAEITGRPIDALPPTEQRGEYNRYDPDFVYRYRKAAALTMNQLADLSQYYLEEARRWEAR